jgi:hypothetical protein
LKDFLSVEDKRKATHAVRNELFKLKAKIKVIREFEVGINEGDNSSAYDISILSSFASRDDLKIYQDHPAHKGFMVFNKNYSVQKAIIDYAIYG